MEWGAGERGLGGAGGGFTSSSGVRVRLRLKGFLADLLGFDVFGGGEDIGVGGPLEDAVQGLELLLGEGVRSQVLPQALHAALRVAAGARAVRAVWKE